MAIADKSPNEEWVKCECLLFMQVKCRNVLMRGGSIQNSDSGTQTPPSQTLLLQPVGLQGCCVPSASLRTLSSSLKLLVSLQK